MHTRKRNWILKRAVLSLAVAALVVPAAAQAARGGSANGQANWFAQTGKSNVAKIGGPRMQITGTETAAVSGPNSFPRHMAVNDAVHSGDLIESVRLTPGNTARDYDVIENRRIEPRNDSTPQVVSSPGFDWGDAGIGAGLMIGLVLLGGIAVSATRHFGKTQTA